MAGYDVEPATSHEGSAGSLERSEHSGGGEGTRAAGRDGGRGRGGDLAEGTGAAGADGDASGAPSAASGDASAGASSGGGVAGAAIPLPSALARVSGCGDAAGLAPELVVKRKEKKWHKVRVPGACYQRLDQRLFLVIGGGVDVVSSPLPHAPTPLSIDGSVNVLAEVEEPEAAPHEPPHKLGSSVGLWGGVSAATALDALKVGIWQGPGCETG